VLPVALVLAGALVAAACRPVVLPPGVPSSGGGPALPPGTLTPGSERVAYSILAPGNGGLDGPTRRDLDDQRGMYDRLDDPVADGTLTDADLARYFKPQPLGADGAPADRVEDLSGLGHRVTIRWDEWSVPHVRGETAEDVAFGAGFAVAEARFVVLELARLLGRSGLLEVVGSPSDLVGVIGKLGELPRISYTEEELAAQIDLAIEQAESPEEAAEILAAVDAYLAGINAWMERAIEWPPILEEWGVHRPRPWTRTDLVAAGIAVNDIFGYAGGDEVGNAAALAALVAELGPELGAATFEDLRAVDDPDATTTSRQRVPVPERGPVDDAAVALPDPPTVEMVDGYAPSGPPSASNYVAVAGSRTATGEPILVGGPQTGYFAPELLMEMELQGGGYQASGVTFPGLGPWILIGRAADYAWSVTAGGSDQVDQRIERLCEPSGAAPTIDSNHYLFGGECRPMTRPPGDPLAMWRTVHGPVSGRATVDGAPVAIAQQRASRGMEAMASVAFWRLNRGEVDGAEGFAPVMAQVPMSFNWLYVDAHDVAYFHSGRFPIRAEGVHPDLPSWGTGEWEWQGFLDPSQHPQEVNPVEGWVTSWNNKPAPGWTSADDTWGVGAAQRVDLLDDQLEGLSGATPADVVAVAQRAATRDLRVTHVLSEVLRVLEGRPAPTAELEDLRRRLSAYVAAGGHRRDRNRDGFYDEPMAAVVDNAWKPLVEAVFGEVLGGYLASPDRRPEGLDDPPSSYGSAFDASAWYSLVVRELRRVFDGAPRPDGVPAMCGGGSPDRCADALWAALRRGRWLTAQQQPFAGDPDRWVRPTFGELIRFIPFVTNTATMRWTNRPTWQQVIQFRAG